jgi:hypothetical protein
VPLLIQVATVTIDKNRRATITAVGGKQFEVNDDGILPVEVSPAGRRLAKTNYLAAATAIGTVRCQLHPAPRLSLAFLWVGGCRLRG